MPGSAELWLEPGGDFIQAENGDLLLAQDTAQTADATRQRIQRLLLTNPRLLDDAGRIISTPDDLFSPDWGAGLPALVDQPVTAAFISALQARIVSAVLSDPGIVANPAPSVTVTQQDTATVIVGISAQTVSGQTMVIPSLPLS